MTIATHGITPARIARRAERAGVVYESSGTLATITLDKPARRNALDAETIATLVEAFGRLQQEAGLRVVLIRARGRMFCPGADLDWLQPGKPGMAERMDAVLEGLTPALAALRQLPAVIVAAVHGAVAGGGIGLMNVADLVIAADGTRFNVAYSRIGGTPDFGVTYHLARLLGERRALELMLLSDDFDAARARELGLVNFVVPVVDFEREVERLVERLARGPAAAHAAIKRLVRHAQCGDLTSQLECERQEIVAAAHGAEFAEGVRALLEHRAPQFESAPAGTTFP